MKEAPLGEGMLTYPRDTKAALLGMMPLSLEERGLYNGILDLIYARGAAVPADPAWIGEKLRVDVRKIKRLTDALVLKGKLTLTGDLLMDDLAAKVLRSRRLPAQNAGSSVDLNKHSTTSLPDVPPISDQKSNVSIHAGAPNFPSLPLVETGGEVGLDTVRAILVRFWGTLPEKIRKFGGTQAQVATAIKARAAEIGVKPETIAAAMLDYYTAPKNREARHDGDDPDKFLIWPKTMVTDGKDRWMDWVDANVFDPVEEKPTATIHQLPRFVERDGKKFLVPALVPDTPTAHLQTLLRQQVTWAEEWKAGEWRRERGPKPGEDGCALWPSVAEHFGIKLADQAA